MGRNYHNNTLLSTTVRSTESKVHISRNSFKSKLLSMSEIESIQNSLPRAQSIKKIRKTLSYLERSAHGLVNVTHRIHSFIHRRCRSFILPCSVHRIIAFHYSIMKGSWFQNSQADRRARQ